MSEELTTTEHAPKWDVALAKVTSRFLSDREQEAFVGVVLAAFNKNPEIMDCTQESILACVRDCAAINLRPNTPEKFCYLIPRKAKQPDGSYALQLGLEIGYQGYAHLLYRDGAARKIQAGVVHQGDHFEHQLGTGGFARHVRSFEPGRKDKPVTCCWVEFTLADGSVAVEIADKDDLDAFEAAMLRQNKGTATPAWKFFRDEMYKKSTLKRGVKLLPKCASVSQAMEIEATQIAALPPPSKALPELSFGTPQSQLPDRAAEEPPRDDSAIGEPEGYNSATGEFEWEPADQ